MKPTNDDAAWARAKLKALLRLWLAELDLLR